MRDVILYALASIGGLCVICFIALFCLCIPFGRSAEERDAENRRQ